MNYTINMKLTVLHMYGIYFVIAVIIQISHTVIEVYMYYELYVALYVNVGFMIISCICRIGIYKMKQLLIF
jgi:hypothetical protein